jgi:prolipoprotein diacylglyceryltransferase
MRVQPAVSAGQLWQHGCEGDVIAHARSNRSVIDSLNAAFDLLPRPEIRLGDRAVPTFLVAAIAGAVAGSCLLVATTAIAGSDVLVAFGLVPLVAIASILLALLRKRRAGIEEWVLLEHLALGLGVAGGALALVDEPLLPWLDRLFAAFCVMFCFGRLGCASAGCCYGHRSSLGIDGGPSHVAPGRRFPVQLLEALCWAVCALLSLLLIAAAAPGVAFATAALLYAASRFLLEGLRADDRPHLFGLSESRWLALLVAAGAIFALDRAGQASRAGLAIGGAGLGAAAILWIGARRWLVLPPATEAAMRTGLTDFGRLLAARGPDAGLHRAELDSAAVVASWMDTGHGFELYVSVSARGDRLLGPAEAELYLEIVGEGLGIRGETPSLVETGAGHFVTRFARDEVHLVDPAARPVVSVTPDADHLQRSYFAPRAGLD